MSTKLRLAILWWVIGILFSFAIVAPFGLQLEAKRLLWMNIGFAFSFLVFARCLIQLRQTFLADKFYLRAVFFVLLFPFIFLGIEQINTFQYMVDYDELNTWLEASFSPERLRWLRQYIQTEFIFVSVGAVITAILLIIRIVLYTWKTMRSQLR